MRNGAWAPTYPDIEAMAQSAIDAGWAPKTPVLVASLDELDKLAMNSVVRGADGTVYRRVTPSFFCWQGTGAPDRFSSEQLLSKTTVELLFAA